MTTKPKLKLSDKFSDVIIQAVKDLKAAERAEKSVDIYMGDWYVPKGIDDGDGQKTEKCEVCFAGAVIRKGVKGTKLENQHLTPDSFDNKTRQKLYALNEIREGNLSTAIEEFYGKCPSILDDCIDVTDYHDDPDSFKVEMLNIAKQLKEIGL